MIISVVYLVVRCLLGCRMMLTLRQVSKDAELLVLRHENAVLRRRISQVRYQPGAALGVRSTAGFTRAFTPRGRRPCCDGQTRSGPVGFQNRAQVADLRVLLRLRSCDWQHRGLVMVRMLYLMFVRLAGWMALLAVACASAPAPLTTPRD